MESRVATSAASPLAVLRPGSLSAYWRFQRAVAKAQLKEWLPAGRRLLIDISGPAAGGPAQAVAAGHTVVRVVPVHPGTAGPRGVRRHPPPLGRVAPVVAEAGLEVTSIRPRTVLSPSTVDHVLRQQPGAMARLVRAELQAGPDGAGPDGTGVSADEAFGINLVATARKPPAG